MSTADRKVLVGNVMKRDCFWNKLVKLAFGGKISCVLGGNILTRRFESTFPVRDKLIIFLIEGESPSWHEKLNGFDHFEYYSPNDIVLSLNGRKYYFREDDSDQVLFELREEDGTLEELLTIKFDYSRYGS